MGKLQFAFLLFFALAAYCAVSPQNSLVYGQGIKKIVAGVLGTIYITLVDTNGTNITTCDYKSSFVVAITQGSTTIAVPTVGCSEDYPPGQYNVVFTLKVVGPYFVSLNFSGTPIASSPYSLRIVPAPPYGPNCKASGPGLTNGIVGFSRYFQIITYDQFNNLNPDCYALSYWKVTLSGAASVKGDVFNCVANQGLYNATYLAKTSGFYVLNVQFNSSNVINQPITLSPGALDPSHCSLQVQGAANVGSLVLVDIIQEDSNGNTITTCTASDWSGFITRGSLNISISVSCSNSVPVFNFTVDEAGTWEAYVYYFGKIIANGAIGINVVAGAVNASNTRAEGEGLIEGVAGVPTYVFIIPYDSYNNRIKTCEPLSNFKITSMSQNCTSNMFKCDNGNYTALYICDLAIQVQFAITYKGSKIENSPIYPTIIAGPPSAPQCYAKGTGTVEAQAGQAAIFTIVTYDQYDNKIAECLPQSEWAEAWSVTVHDSQVAYTGVITACVDGEYTAEYTIIQLSQLYVLYIFYYSSPISNSGFTLTTYAGPPYPPYCNASGPGLSGSVAGVATWASVVCSDQYKNPISSCKYISTNWTVFLENSAYYFDGYFLNCTPAKYAVVYVGYNVTVADEYDFNIWFNNYTVYDEPVTIVPGPYDPDNTAANGPGVGQDGALTAGDQTIFYLVGRDKWNNTIHECPSQSDWTITIIGQSFGTVVSFTIVGCVNANGMTNVTYTPTIAQNYYVNIKFNGSSIIGDPYVVQVVASTPTSASILANGTGTVSGIAGLLTSFNVFLYDKYNNTINYCGYEDSFTVSLVGNQAVSGYVGCKNGFYTGYYNCTVVGTYTMTVNYNGNQISNSPFHPVISANVIWAPNCIVSGDKTEYAGEIGSLSISCSDEWNNAINNCNQASKFTATSNNKYFTFANSFTSCSNGVYSTTYNGTQATTVIVTISWSGTQIGNSPLSVKIIPNYIVAINSVATGTGLENNVVGSTVYIDVSGYDWWDNLNTTCFSNPAWDFDWLQYPKGGNVTISQYSADFCNQGTYTYTYRTTVIGTYELQITWLNSAIYDSPWYFTYSAGPPDPSKSFANGTGTQNIVAGNVASFNIYTFDSFGNVVSNCSYMNWEIGFTDPTYSSKTTKITCASSSGIFTVKYYGYQADTWVLTVGYGGIGIENSPFNVVEVANVIYAPTSVVDLSKTTNVLAGESYNFEIVTRDQWKNNNITCKVPLSSFGVSIQSTNSKTIFTGVVYDCVAGSHFDASFSINISGSYYLSVFYENGLVSNQTYLIQVSAGTVYDYNCVVSGPLITSNQIAGIAGLVQITQYDQYMNLNTTCLNNYWLIDIYTQGAVYLHKYLPSSYCKNGVYSVDVTLETATTYHMNVSGDISNTKKSPYTITVINNQVYASNSAIWKYTIPSSSVIGAPVSILIDLRDKYENPVLNCNMTNSFWAMNVNITASIKFSTSCKTGNNNMTLTYAFTHSYSAQDAWVKIEVLYSNTQVINSPMTYELLPGQPSAYSYAVGHGVEDYYNNLAGDWIFFDIYAVNEYNISIPGCASFAISYSPEVVISSSSCVRGVTAVQYNATLATSYSIKITLNGKSIVGSPYTGVVYPNVLDLAMTEYYGPLFNGTPANDSGTFNLRIRDHWGNPEINIGPDLFTGVLTPSCSNTSVDCQPEEDGVYNCTYSVQNGGIYCFTVSYNNTILPGFTPVYLDIIGGLGCSGSCNYNGYCIDGNCTCTTKYAGSSCQYKISSHYMTMGLAIGLIVGLSIAFLLIGLLVGCLLARMTSKGDRLLN